MKPVRLEEERALRRPTWAWCSLVRPLTVGCNRERGRDGHGQMPLPFPPLGVVLPERDFPSRLP